LTHNILAAEERSGIFVEGPGRMRTAADIWRQAVAKLEKRNTGWQKEFLRHPVAEIDQIQILPQPVAKLIKSKVIYFLPQLVAEISLSQTGYPMLSAPPFLKRANGMMKGLQKA